MSEPERALEGIEEIGAWLETLWRRRGKRIRVSRGRVRWYIRSQGLPTDRLAGGPHVAAPSKVEAWFNASLTSTEK